MGFVAPFMMDYGKSFPLKNRFFKIGGPPWRKPPWVKIIDYEQKQAFHNAICV